MLLRSGRSGYNALVSAEVTEERGPGLLAQVSNEMVKAQKEFFGRGPENAKAYVLDDVLIVIMRGGLTTAERTMLDFGHPDQVRAFRQLFQNEMSERLMRSVSELTGRKVVTYQSQVLFEPDMMVEIFVFEPHTGG
jgi:uncharacterized protein YbcI